MSNRVQPVYLSVTENPLIQSQHDYAMYELLIQILTDTTISKPLYMIKQHQLALLDWIYELTPKLKDSDAFTYNVSTRCRWILSGLLDFPICQFCGKPFGMNRDMPVRYDYSNWCSNRCRQANPIVVARTKQTKLLNHGDPNYCNADKAKQTFLEHYGVTNPNKCKKIRDKLEQTNLAKYGSKCVFSSQIIKEQIRQTNIERYGVASTLANAEIREKGKKTMLERYGVEYSAQSEQVKQKAKQTFLEHYGVDNNMKSKEGLMYWQKCFRAKYGVSNPYHMPEMLKKMRRKYFYDNTYFDSAPELAFYIWLKDNNIDFIFHPDESFEYESNNKKHLYFPDFRIGNDMYIEIKGDQFFKNGQMVCPYHGKQIDDTKYMLLCEIFDAKYRCMLQNDVIILRYTEYCMFLLYVRRKYGNRYLSNFRVNKKLDA